MRVTGRGIWGEPADRAEAMRVLRRLPELGVDFVDTADSYGPDVSETAHSRGAASLSRHGDRDQGRPRPAPVPISWTPLGRPEYLIQQALKSRRNLGVEPIDLWQFHRIDPKVPRGEQFGAIRSLIADEGVIRLRRPERSLGRGDRGGVEGRFRWRRCRTATISPIARSEAVLDHCERHGIGFIPWFPLAAGELAGPGSALAARRAPTARRRDRSRSPGCSSAAR